jgi:hypothetical protein
LEEFPVHKVLGNAKAIVMGTMIALPQIIVGLIFISV